jgi:hypothetical protein
MVGINSKFFFLKSISTLSSMTPKKGIEPLTLSHYLKRLIVLQNRFQVRGTILLLLNLFSFLKKVFNMKFLMALGVP